MGTSGEREEGRGKIEIVVQSIMYKISKLHEYIVQHREYCQYFIININGV